MATSMLALWAVAALEPSAVAAAPAPKAPAARRKPRRSRRLGSSAMPGAALGARFKKSAVIDVPPTRISRAQAVSAWTVNRIAARTLLGYGRSVVGFCTIGNFLINFAQQRKN